MSLNYTDILNLGKAYIDIAYDNKDYALYAMLENTKLSIGVVSSNYEARLSKNELIEYVYILDDLQLSLYEFVEVESNDYNSITVKYKKIGDTAEISEGQFYKMQVIGFENISREQLFNIYYRFVDKTPLNIEDYDIVEE